VSKPSVGIAPGTEVVNKASTAIVNKTNNGIQVGFWFVIFLIVKSG